jgi:hypothetical protein
MPDLTAILVLFALVCVLFPRLIDNRPQYYAGLALVLLAVLFTPFLGLADSRSGRFVLGLILAITQVAAFLLLFLSAGGLTVRGLTREMASAFEVIRRGETEKEILIPIGNEQKDRKRKTAVESQGEPIERFDLTTEEGDDAGYPPKKPVGQDKPNRDDGPISMD